MEIPDVWALFLIGLIVLIPVFCGISYYAGKTSKIAPYIADLLRRIKELENGPGRV